MFSRAGFLWLGIFFVGNFVFGCLSSIVIASAINTNSDWPLVFYMGIGISWLVLCNQGARRGWLVPKDKKPGGDKPRLP